MKWIWCLLSGSSSCAHQYCVRDFVYIFHKECFQLVVQPIVLSTLIVSVCDLNYPHPNAGFRYYAYLPDQQHCLVQSPNKVKEKLSVKFFCSHFLNPSPTTEVLCLTITCLLHGENFLKTSQICNFKDIILFCVAQLHLHEFN